MPHTPYHIDSPQDAGKYMSDMVQGMLSGPGSTQNEIFDAIEEVVSYEAPGSQQTLRNLLTMTAFMENSMGADTTAFGRDYTRSFMSIDDDAFKTIFERDTDTRQKYADRYEEMGLPSDMLGLSGLLQSDDPLASVAVARQIYGLSPKSLPANNPEALFQYYMKEYNRGGAKKYGSVDKARRRFMTGYDLFIK
tara:strand:+ start:712 stop:1290 length:579 start_codon:yes stop_codon:yes gene_type:complete